MMMKFALKLLSLTTLVQFATADIVVDNELIKPEEIFDMVWSEDSTVWYTLPNITKYYCVFRSMWDEERHPKNFPDLARWSNPVLYSSTKQFLPWLRNRATTWGVEKIAEAGFTDTFHLEVQQAGRLVKDYGEGQGFFINREEPEKNFCFLDGVEVDADFPFLSGMAGINPSPDWFTGFYLLDSVDEYDRTYWNNFLIRTYPWDAGTDSGDTYTAEDQDLDPPLNVVRIYKNNAPNGIFLSPDGTEVMPVSEWQCVLHTCDAEVGSDECQKPNWPPQNGCDLLKYPGCENYCDPETDTPCQECHPQSEDEGNVFYPNCCQSNYEPKHGSCDDSGAAEIVGMGLVTVLTMGMLGFIL